ncbi:Tetratricopeptide repeat-domain-containing protein [Lasiosphaeria hispida]|uniref:Tetratricopeptide repeat-domain-containing protein n=1 Tax=Lasiosphaeria hispida TaxID=260671 RepID=A0AAJ0MB48_9PEZI|nr:Tetratricopeptide repeat-domain-containing protein [Lasiosphaeria hispida]
MGNLASTYRSQGRWAEAEPLKVQVVEARKRVLGPEHPDTLDSMNNLAITWKDLGRLQDAENLMRECIRLRQQVLGKEHPNTVSSVSQLRRWAAVTHKHAP